MQFSNQLTVEHHRFSISVASYWTMSCFPQTISPVCSVFFEFDVFWKFKFISFLLVKILINTGSRTDTSGTRPPVLAAKYWYMLFKDSVYCLCSLLDNQYIITLPHYYIYYIILYILLYTLLLYAYCSVCYVLVPAQTADLLGCWNTGFCKGK